MKKPLIAVTGNYMFDLAGKFKNQKKSYVNDDYIQSVVKGGGIPFIMPLIHDENTIEAQLERVDGIIISGGSDVNPFLYGEEHLSKCGEIIPERDNFDMILLKYAFEKKIPILGICRGVQVINAFCGGTLYQDLSYNENHLLKHQQSELPHIPVHRVEVKEGSLLNRFSKKEELRVNSFHHQAVKDLAPGFMISGTSSDGIVEAIESLDPTHLVLGVQWHPEGMAALGDEDMMNIFKNFINECI